MPPCCGDLVGHPALVNPGGKNGLMLDRVIYREIAPVAMALKLILKLNKAFKLSFLFTLLYFSYI